LRIIGEKDKSGLYYVYALTVYMESKWVLPLFNYKQKVIIHILLNDPSSDEKQVIKSFIEHMDGVKDCFFTPHSNVSDIVIFAAWKEEDGSKKLNELEQINGIKSVVPFLFTNNQLRAF
jgi:hypothetical protein